MNAGTSAFACLAGMTPGELETAGRRLLSALPRYEPGDEEVAACMVGRGGRFMKQLGRAFHCADPANRQKIKETWPAEWASYRASVIPPERADFGDSREADAAEHGTAATGGPHQRFGAAA